MKGIVPNEIIRRGKQGFAQPLDKWILNKKYDIILEEGLKILKNLNPDLYTFYKEKVFKEKSKFFYKIRLFLFAIWFEHWIK